MATVRPSSDKIMTERQWKILHRELDRHRRAALSSGKDQKFVHDYYLINLAWMCGLRISEVAELNWGDITDDQCLVVRNGKGGKARNVFYGPKTERLIQEYRSFKERQGAICESPKPVFVNVHRRRYGPSGISRRMQFWVERAGLPKSLTFHGLRHGYATRLLNQGMPLHDVREALGHSSVAVTSVYLHFTEDSRERFRRLL